MKMDWKSLLINESFGLLPGILQMVEVTHARKPGDPPNGVTKSGAAVQIAQTALTIAAAQGVIDNSDAQNIAAIADLVQHTVVSMQGQGKLGGAKTPAPGPSLVQPIPTPAPVAVQPTVLNPPTKLPFNLAGAVGRATT